jgi:hypothetical protein
VCWYFWVGLRGAFKVIYEILGIPFEVCVRVCRQTGGRKGGQLVLGVHVSVQRCRVFFRCG